MKVHTFLLVGCLTLGCDRKPAATGDDHGHAHGTATHAPHDSEELEPNSITQFTEQALLFVEFPPLIKGEAATFLAHFSVLATGEPVRSGTVALHLKPRSGGTALTFTAEKPARDGLFKPEANIAQSGEYEGQIVLKSDQASATFDVGTIQVYADKHEAEHEAEDGDEPTDAVPFLLEQQWKIPLRLQEVTTRKMVHRLRVPAEVHAAPGGSAVISSSVAGRLVRNESGALPRIGQTVQAGEVVGFIEPPLPVTADLALRSIDLNLKSIEVEQTIGQTRQRVEFAQRGFDRVKAVREKGVGTEQQLDEAKQAVDLAKAEYDGAVAMQQQFKLAASKLDELRASSGSDGGSNALRIPLRAPIAGRIVSTKHVEGEHVDAQQEIFRVVNAERLWIVGNVSEFDLAGLSGSPAATFTLPSSPQAPSMPVLQFADLGTVLDSESRTVPVRYDAANADGRLRLGMIGELEIATAEATDAVAVPESAIVMDRGRPVAFVMLEGETFQRREVETGIRDGGVIEIKSGLKPGDRVVVNGANAVRIASLSPASFGHGHAH